MLNPSLQLSVLLLELRSALVRPFRLPVPQFL
jgi:hypothetical protein